MNVLRRLQDDDKPVLEFSSYLFAAARNESYALMRRGARVEPSETLPEQPAVTVDVETQPERAAILHDSQEAVRRANATLPPRHREVLALRELGDHSYGEIGRIMGISENSAAQLIWRARSKLREAMTAGAVASVVATSTDCERAQVLLSRIQDGEPVDELDRHWLDRHLDECGSCRAARGMLLEVGAFYCAWVPVAAGLALKADTLTAAGSLIGADWSGVAAGLGGRRRGLRRRSGRWSGRSGRDRRSRWHRRRRSGRRRGDARRRRPGAVGGAPGWRPEAGAEHRAASERARRERAGAGRRELRCRAREDLVAGARSAGRGRAVRRLQPGRGAGGRRAGRTPPPDSSPSPPSREPREPGSPEPLSNSPATRDADPARPARTRRRTGPGRAVRRRGLARSTRASGRPEAPAGSARHETGPNRPAAPAGRLHLARPRPGPRTMPAGTRRRRPRSRRVGSRPAWRPSPTRAWPT